MDAVGWTVLAWAVVGLRAIGAFAVAMRRVPAWSGPVVEVVLWIGAPAVLDLAALRNVEFWVGLVVLLILWVPGIALARRAPSRSRPDIVVLIATATLALAVQAAITHFVVAGTVSEATAGQVCLSPRKTYGLGGDLFPLPAGTTLTLCVQGRPGGGYIGD